MRWGSYFMTFGERVLGGSLQPESLKWWPVNTGHRTSAMFDRYAIVSNVDALMAQIKVAEFRKQA
jgi:hypothetical protein